MKPLTIGKVAREAGIGVETVRFYERQGLIPEPPRSDAGYRYYPPRAISRLRFIRRAKELGFSLKEISDLLSLRVDAGSTCADIKARTEEKIASIKRKIRDLQKMKKALDRLAAACSGRGPTSECPILEAIQAEEKGVTND